jgi:hypothetical protein
MNADQRNKVPEPGPTIIGRQSTVSKQKHPGSSGASHSAQQNLAVFTPDRYNLIRRRSRQTS